MSEEESTTDPELQSVWETLLLNCTVKIHIVYIISNTYTG